MSSQRFSYDNLIKYLIYGLGIISTIYHVVALVFYPLPPNIFRTMHLMIVLIMTFLIYPSTSRGTKNKPFIDGIILAVLSIVTSIYAMREIDNILGIRMGGVYMTQMDVVMGIICIVVVLEAARRTSGPALPLIAMIFIAYAFAGKYIPGMLGHRGFNMKRVISVLYTFEGIYGTALSTAATFVAMFIIFAAFLEKTGAGETFFDLAKGLCGRFRGGPAKVAVIASALFGTISGSAVACVAAVGAIIVPLMVRIGYEKDFSAASISAASIGGQIMPPVMAAGAFLMAEFLGVPYLYVAKAAVIPALMFFVTIWISIDCYAAKMNLKGLDPREIPKIRDVLKHDGIVLLPLFLLIFMLVILKKSAILCAFAAIIASCVVCLVDKKHRMSFKTFVDTLSIAGRNITSTAVACACAGIVIGVIAMTGLGLKVSTLIINLSGGHVSFALILSMCTAILFGMGLPTTVSYLLCVSVLSPVLIQLGIVPIAAHMFIFYFSCLSGITPPVALAAYTGAGIAQTDPIRTATLATKLAIVSFFLPYMFVYDNAYLMQGSAASIAWKMLVGIATCYSIAGVVQGWLVIRLSIILRVILTAITVLLMLSGRNSDFIGLVAFAAVIVFLKIRGRSSANELI